MDKVFVVSSEENDIQAIFSNIEAAHKFLKDAAKDDIFNLNIELHEVFSE